MITLMVGRTIETLYPRSDRKIGEVILEASELAGESKPQRADFVLHRGEVLGIAGLNGAGRTEMLRAIFGLEKVRKGKIRIGAYQGPASPGRRWKQGVGLVSEDRKLEGLALGMSIADNLTLTNLKRLGPLGLIFHNRQKRAANDWIAKMDIRCREPFQAVGELSGGNQQKVAIARLLYHDVDVLLLDEPTRGIDVASKEQIYRLIDDLALQGKAILIVSSYLPELLGICDRIAVMHKGELGSAVAADQTDSEKIMQEALGG
jgi:ribose transport system ATP-binding protein